MRKINSLSSRSLIVQARMKERWTGEFGLTYVYSCMCALVVIVMQQSVFKCVINVSFKRMTQCINIELVQHARANKNNLFLVGKQCLKIRGISKIITK